MLVVSLLAAIVGSGFVAYEDATSWYRVVDRSEIEGLEILKSNSTSHDLVVASEGHHSNPLGWWVEGYAERLTYTAVQSEALMFKEERQQAEIANAIFSGELSASETRSTLDEIGADFLVVDRRGPDASFLESPFAKSLPVLHDSENLVILRAR